MSEEEIEQERINKEDKLKALEECIEKIKELLEVELNNLEDYQGLVEEISYLVKEINDEFY